MVKGAIAEPARFDDESLRTILPDEERSWRCPNCETEVILTMDRVIEHHSEHPATVLRETQYWRCPICNEAAGWEIMDRVEPIEYITSNA